MSSCGKMPPRVQANYPRWPGNANRIMTEFIGWFSSAILLATIAKQIWKQWQARSSVGVSKWLFIGQLAASSGFTLYSYLLHNWVFVVTNLLMVASAVVGLSIVMIHKRQRRIEEPRPADHAAG